MGFMALGNSAGENLTTKWVWGGVGGGKNFGYLTADISTPIKPGL